MKGIKEETQHMVQTVRTETICLYFLISPIKTEERRRLRQESGGFTVSNDVGPEKEETDKK